MSVERHFLGWNAPVTTKVREFLLPERISTPVDLENTLIVVPTTQAGRRLREAIAIYCSDHKSALLSARTVTPAWFIRGASTGKNKETSAALAKALWAEVLLQIEPSEYSSFLPAQGMNRDYSWALFTAEMLDGLRKALSDAGLTIADVPAAAGDALHEAERWEAMARLEKRYLDRVHELGFRDQVELKIKQADSPELPEAVERIVLAAVPAPTPLTLRALEKISKQAPIEVLVHAPPELKDLFDEWGRPVPEKWAKMEIKIPDPERNVVLAGPLETQADAAIGVIAESAEEFGPHDIAIGVPDRTVIPFMESALASHKLPAFDPAEKSVTEHRLYKLLESLCALFVNNSYEAFASFLRHPDLLLFFEKSSEISTCDLLTELDEFQNAHLPMEFTDIEQQFSGGKYKGRDDDVFGKLGKAIAFARTQINAVSEGAFDEAVRGFLDTVFDVQTLSDDDPRSEELKRAAVAVDTVLVEMAEASRLTDIDQKQAAALFLIRLAGETYTREREPSVIDLEGWLELAWNNAPLLIVTGMNEDSVPATRLGDVFMPDSLRKALKLQHDESRLARDAYLMTDFIASRKDNGRVCFISGKTSGVGDPLKPSRLLFRCSDKELLRRTGVLFGDVAEVQKNYPFSVSFKLDPSAPSDVEADRLKITRMSATRFKNYLKCPFRFYLQYVLGMEALDDEKDGLDALDFGNVVHSAMQAMVESGKFRKSADAGKMGAFLRDYIDKWGFARFGKNPPLPVTMLLESARQRLKAAARVQAELIEEGWEIIGEPEKWYELSDLNGMKVVGRVDRIDRHTGRKIVRVIDYKTTDNGTKPKAEHIAKARNNAPAVAKFTVTEKGKEKEYMWKNLQLPLYRLFIEESGEFDGYTIEPAYFNMPKALGKTGVDVWDDFNNDLFAAARNCACKVIDAVRAGQFWPPADVYYDDYESLFFREVEDCVDGKKLKKVTAKK